MKKVKEKIPTAEKQENVTTLPVRVGIGKKCERQ
jgi:hypothetical protein